MPFTCSSIVAKLRFTLFSSAILFLCFSGKAQGQSKKEKIRSLFSLMKQDSLAEKTMSTMLNSSFMQMQKQFSDTTIYNAAFREKFSDILNKEKASTIEMTKKLINDDMVNIYDKYFTIQEVEAFIDFYKSPAGQKMIDQLPNITKDVITIMSTKYGPSMQQDLMNQINELFKSTEHASK